MKYEDFKRNHLSTERLCADLGFAFAPMMIETCGGFWGPAASTIFAEPAETKSIFTSEPKDVGQTQFFQSLGVIRHRENVRAVARRTFPIDTFSPDLLLAASTLQALEAEAAAK